MTNMENKTEAVKTGSLSVLKQLTPSESVSYPPCAFFLEVMPGQSLMIIVSARIYREEWGGGGGGGGGGGAGGGIHQIPKA